MQNDLQLLFLIFGTVIGAFIIYKAFKDRQTSRKAPTIIRREFQKTIIDNTHKAVPYKKAQSLHLAESDPLLDNAEFTYTELPKLEKEIPLEKTKPQAPAPKTSADEIVTLVLIPRNTASFSGLELSVVFEEEGYQYGKMRLFHRHENQAPSQPILYSIASMVEPGVFYRETMENEDFRGIVLWVVFKPGSNPEVFEKMLADAKHLAEKLNATLCEQKRKQLTVQTISEMRAKIQECCECESISQSAS